MAISAIITAALRANQFMFPIKTILRVLIIKRTFINGLKTFWEVKLLKCTLFNEVQRTTGSIVILIQFKVNTLQKGNRRDFETFQWFYRFKVLTSSRMYASKLLIEFPLRFSGKKQIGMDFHGNWKKVYLSYSSEFLFIKKWILTSFDLLIRAPIWQLSQTIGL